MATFQPFVGFASSLGTVILIYFGGRLVLNQTLPLDDLVAFFLYINLFYQPVRTLSGAWEGVQEAMAGAERVAELLDEEPDVVEIPDAVVLPARTEGEIAFQDVGFRFPHRGRGAGAHQPRGPRRHFGRACGADRRGQDDAGEPDPALL